MNQNNHICLVNDLSDLLVCKADNCLQESICCRYCFTWKHLGNDQKIHHSVKFQASDFYKQIIKLFNMEWLISQKLTKSLGSFQLSKQIRESMTNYAFYGSTFFKSIFQTEEGKNQFFVIRSLYLKQSAQFTTLAQFSQAMLVLDDSTINKEIKKIISCTIEQNSINGDLDLYYGVDPTYIQNFIEFQRQTFIKYCGEIVNKENQLYSEEGFSIYRYLDWRVKNSERDAVYHSKQFTNFLLQKYIKNAEEKGIFTLQQYFINFWHFFSTLIHTDPTVCLYFDEQVKFYKVYQKFMKQNNLFITLQGFRIWKLNNGTSTYLPYLKNHYFLQSFIFTFIHSLIQKTYYFQSDELINQTFEWRDFMLYIKDYTFIIQGSDKTFQMVNYKEYFEFRKGKLQFVKRVRQAKQLTLNEEYIISYLNFCFKNKKLPSLKAYKVYCLDQDESNKIKSQEFANQANKLKSVLEEEQKDQFYQYIYFNFLNYCQNQSRPLTKQVYFDFKAEVMKNIDGRFIQQQEEMYRNGQFNRPQQEQYQGEVQKVQQGAEQRQQQKKQQKKKTEGVVGEEINQLQSKIARQLQQDSSEDQMQICFCCNGDPYNCRNDDCLMMGCCTACCL